MNANVQHEIEEFLRQKAPGLHFRTQDNPAFNSTTLELSLKIDLKQLISNSVPDMAFGDKIMSMLAEVQKAAVTAIGLEEYVRERELAVLDRLQERMLAGRFPDEGIFEEARQELGGNPSA